MNKKFVAKSTAARKIGRFGFHNKSEDEIHQAMSTSVGWRMIDSANLGRIADALEKLVLLLSKGSK